MENPRFTAAIAHNEPRILAMGFELNKDSTDEDYRQYRRGDFALSLFIERYEEDLSIHFAYLLDKSIKKGGARVGYTIDYLMQILDQDLWLRYQNTLEEDFDQPLSLFLDFFEKHGSQFSQFPLPQPLRSQYRAMGKADPMANWTGYDDPSAMDELPPYMEKIS